MLEYTSNQNPFLFKASTVLSAGSDVNVADLYSTNPILIDLSNFADWTKIVNFKISLFGDVTFQNASDRVQYGLIGGSSDIFRSDSTAYNLFGTSNILSISQCTWSPVSNSYGHLLSNTTLINPDGTIKNTTTAVAFNPNPIFYIFGKLASGSTSTSTSLNVVTLKIE